MSDDKTNYGMQGENGGARVSLRAIGAMQEVTQAAWDGLLIHPGPAVQPFLRWAFLDALEQSASVGEGTGWLPHHLLLERTLPDGETELLGAIPGYLKEHSYGEYVFDWAWAEAYQRHGLDYYPKLLAAIPFSPIPGARLLGAPEWQASLATGWISFAKRLGVSSAHCLLASSAELDLLAKGGALRRHGIQFHWHNRPGAGYGSFEDFLSVLDQPKRKKIRAERRKVSQAGITTEILVGEQIGQSDWDYFYRCYVRTYREHHSTPYLTRDFFYRLAQQMAPSCVLVIARHGEGPAARRVGASLLLRDEEALYGRYWGATEHFSCLHFELAYYLPIDYAIAQGISRIEGGAQGEHKLARGFLPVPTGSAHWIADAQFRAAIANFLAREQESVQQYGDELAERSPYAALDLPEPPAP